jgi:TP901 family phage tail tape measure protein
MSGLLTLGVVLSAVDSLSPVLGTATGNLDKLDNKISSVGGNITKLGTLSLALGTAITAPLKGALDDYQDIAAAQGEIASLGIDDTGIKSITKSAREFSNEFAGTTAPEFIKASYDIKSGIASLSDTAVGEFTKTAAMTASATKSSTAEMTSLFATGYGIYRKQFKDFGSSTILGWKDLSNEEKDIKFGEYFSAGIASSVQAFKTDGSNMSNALSTLGANATSAGVSFAEQLSILGQLQKTMSGSEAATKYKAFLGSVSGAGDKLDLQFTDANNQLLNMPKIIGKIKDKYGDTIDALESAELKKAFGTEEAVALIKLMYNETDTLTKNIDTMSISLENGTKKTLEMAKATNKGKEFDLLGQQLDNTSSLIGGAFAPIALELSEVIGGVTKDVSSWMEENEELSSTIFTSIAVLGGFLTVLGTVGIVLGTVSMALPFLSGGLGLLSGAFGMLGTVMSLVGRIFLMNPIGLAVTAIAGAAYLIYENWEPIGAFFSDLWSGIQDAAAPVLDWIGEKIGSVTGAMDAIGGWFGGDTKVETTTNALSTVSTKGNKQSIEKTQRDVLNSNVSSSNAYMYKNSQANTAQSKVIHNEPTYHITVTNPNSDVDVVRAIKEHEKRQKNKSYEDD